MNRRGFFAGVAAAVFIAVLRPGQLLIKRGGAGFGSSIEAFLDVKRREIDALFELAQAMRGAP